MMPKLSMIEPSASMARPVEVVSPPSSVSVDAPGVEARAAADHAVEACRRRC